MQLFPSFVFPFLFFSDKLGTHGSPRRRGAGQDPQLKGNFNVNDVKRLVAGMHNTENVNTGK